MRYEFKGGIYPLERNKLTAGIAIQDYRPQGDMIFPLLQHEGTPAVCIVKKGDSVLRGQIIAKANGELSAHIISSVSGRVKAIEPRLTIYGKKVMSVVIENDGLYTPVEGLGTKRDIMTLNRQIIIDAIRDAGVVGLGGEGMPTHVKLSPKDPDAIDCVIVNAAECEPYLTSDHRQMLECGRELIEGLRMMLILFKNAMGVIAIGEDKPDAIEALTGLVVNEPRMKVVPLKTKYPMGNDRSLIYSVTGRKINSMMTPDQAGCMMDSVSTVLAIYRAVMLTTPLMERVITVSGDGVMNPGNFRAPIGTPLSEIVEAAGGLKPDVKKLICGGPMMGIAMANLDAPVSKTVSAVTCFTKDPTDTIDETACIRCGRCVSVCPSRLVPTMMLNALQRQDIPAFVRLHGMECMECGSCAYVCPARRPLTQAFKLMRTAVLKQRAEQKKQQEAQSK